MAENDKEKEKNKQADRRVRYTLMVIRQSFVALLKKKPISRITVKEICEGADVNRATFYAHYQDPYDLLRRIESDIVDDVNRYLSSYDFRKMSEIPTQMLEKILEYIRDNAELFDLLLLNANGDMQFRREITDIIGRQHFVTTADSGDAQYMYLFYANGAIGVIMKWLEDGMKMPVEDLAALILRLSIHGSGAILHL